MLSDAKKSLVRQFRRDPTPTEAKLRGRLTGRSLAGLKFRRQRPIDCYIADFCCDELRLIVEIDGAVHLQGDQPEYDANRQAYLEAHGYTVLRIAAHNVETRLNAVLQSIHSKAMELRQKPLTPNPSPAEGRGESE